MEEVGRKILQKMDEQSCTGDFDYNKFLKLSVKQEVVDKFKTGTRRYSVLQR